MYQWFALTVKHQHENPTQKLLRMKDLETLVPTYLSVRQWSDRPQQVELPVFAGYVFCRFQMAERVRVLNTPGVGRIVGFGGAPAPIDESEMEALRTVIDSKLPLNPWPYLKPGDRVQVERGPLRGLSGTLLSEKDHLRMVIGIEMLQRSLAVELEPSMIVPERILSKCAISSAS